MILVGGHSSRFGANKALHVWRGRALVDHIIAAVRVALDPPDIWINVRRVGQDPRLLEHLQRHEGLTFLEDDPALSGPAAGLSAGFSWAARRQIPWVLALSCDLPAVRIQLLARMAELALDPAHAHDALVPVTRDEFGQPRFEALHALFRPEPALDALERATADGRMSLQRVIGALASPMLLGPAELEALDPAWRRSLTNVNTVDDLDLIEE